VIRALFVLILLWPMAAWAEPVTLKPGEILRGHFVQERFLVGFAQPLRSEGSFVLAPGQGLIWRGGKPFAVVTVISAAGMTQSLGGKETMRLSAVKAPFLARLHDVMAGAMAGDWRALDGDFLVVSQNDGVVLTPRRADLLQSVKSIQAHIGRFVDAVEVEKGEGDRDRLLFSQQNVDRGPLSEDEAAAFAAIR
jgi:hypothetical protein